MGDSEIIDINSIKLNSARGRSAFGVIEVSLGEAIHTDDTKAIVRSMTLSLRGSL